MIELKYRLFDGGNKTEIEIFLGSMAKVGDIIGEGNERYLQIYHANDWNVIPGKTYVRLYKNHYVIKIEKTWAVVATIDEVIQDKKKLKNEAVEFDKNRHESIKRLRANHFLFEWNG
jgi:hypothetical protein